MLCLYVGDWPRDWERGKQVQGLLGSGVVPFESGSECMMGQYQRLIDTALAEQRGPTDAQLGPGGEG
jgi:hypothetical protein